MATGAEIYRVLQAGDTEPLRVVFDVIEQLYRDFEVEAEELKAANDQMMRYWEGNSADAASKGVAPLIQAHLDSAPLINDAGGSIDSQAQAFSEAKGAVTPVPDEPAEPGFFAKAAGVIAPGTGIAEEYESYRDGMAAHEAANANNVRVMQQYTAATGDTRNKLPADYGVIEDDGAVINVSTHASSAPAGSAVAGPSLGGAAGPTAGGAPVTSGYTGGGLAAGPTSGVQQPTAPATGSQTFSTPAPRPVGGTPIAPVGAPPVVGGSGGDETRTSQRTTRGTTARPPASSSRAGARMTTGSTPRSASAASQIQRGASAAARFSGSNPLPGKSTGVASPTTSGSTTAAAKSVSGMSRAGTSAGVAPGAAGRGRGDDDKEHKDKYFVKEELDTGLVTEVDELGEKIVDENTGSTVVQPVIGDDSEKD